MYKSIDNLTVLNFISIMINMKYYYIYLITNQIDSKTYVGQHHGELDDNYLGLGNIILQARSKYGDKNFTKDILAVCSSKFEVDILEKEYIKLYREIGKAEYNIADGGDGGLTSGSFKPGHPVNDATRRKIKEARANQNFTEEQIQKRNQSVKEFWDTKDGDTMRKRLSELNKDKKHTQGMHWYNNGKENIVAYECPEGFVKGRLVTYKRSEESKLKTKQSMRAFYDSERSIEVRKKISEANTGIKFTEERKKHISEAKKGKPGREQSDEIKKKIGETVRKRWAERKANQQ